MKYETYYINASWGTRLESPQQCAERLVATMNEFRECHDLVTRWHRPANTLAEALRLILEPKVTAIERHFTSLLPDDPSRGGYRLSMWNGREPAHLSCAMDVSAGRTMQFPPLYNKVILDFGNHPDKAPSLYRPEVLRDLLEIIARCWQPDWAFLMSRWHRDRHLLPGDTKRIPGKPLVGWMTYLRNKRLATLPAELPCKTRAVGDLGRIFIVTDEHRFSVDNPEDIAAARALESFLEEHGALAAISPMLPM